MVIMGGERERETDRVVQAIPAQTVENNFPVTGVVYAHKVLSCQPTRGQCVMSAATTGACTKEVVNL